MIKRKVKDVCFDVTFSALSVLTTLIEHSSFPCRCMVDFEGKHLSKHYFGPLMAGANLVRSDPVPLTAQARRKQWLPKYLSQTKSNAGTGYEIRPALKDLKLSKFASILYTQLKEFALVFQHCFNIVKTY